MLSFEVYCDIKCALRREAILKKADVFERIVEEQDNESAIRSLISNCNRKTVLRLIRYFDIDAPVQSILQERLHELGFTQEEGSIEEYVKERKRASESWF